MHRAISFLIVLLLAVALVPKTHAQNSDEIDEPVRACTLEELGEVAALTVDLFSTITEITVGVTNDNAMERLVQVDELWLEFWQDVIPELPDCAYALRFERMFARSLGQVYIGMVWVAVGSDQMARPHIPLMDEAADEIVEFNELTVELTEQMEEFIP